MMRSNEKELYELTMLESRARPYGMGMSKDKTKAMVSKDVKVTIHMDWEQHQRGRCFKCLGAVIPADGSSREEIGTRIGLAATGMAKLKPMLKSKTMSFVS